MTIDWFSIKHGTPSDAKLTMIAKKIQVRRCEMTAVWFELMDYASRYVTRGHVTGCDMEQIAFNQDIEIEIVKKIYDALVEKNVIQDEQLASWEKHQPKGASKGSDPTAAERKRRQREREREERERQQNEAVTRDGHDVTVSHDVTRDSLIDKNRPDKNRLITPTKPSPSEKIQNSESAETPRVGSFSKNFGSGQVGSGWHISSLLSLEALNGFKETARLMGWDWGFLVKKYHEYHAEPPKYPDRAFKTWLINFTKGRPPP